MNFSHLLEKTLILPKAVCASKDELIEKLADLVFAAGRPLPFSQKDMLATVHLREQIGGTLLPSGLSVPHARLKDFDGFYLALGIPAEPLFSEGLQIRMMALMITSQSGGPWYLGALAALTKISRDREYFSRLCGAQNAEEFFAVLRERDPELD